MKKNLSKCWDCLSLVNWIGVLTLFLLLKWLQKIGTLIHSLKLLSPEVALTLSLLIYLIQPCIKYNCHILACVPICYLDMLDKLQKRI